MDYTVQRSSRARRPSIKVKRSGAVIVTVPEGRDVDTDSLVEHHARWIESQKERQAAFRSRIPHRTFEDGAHWTVLGRERRISVGSWQSHTLTDEELQLADHAVERTSIKAALESLLRDVARDRAETVIDQYADRIDGTVNQLYIRDQGTKWGSCSGKNNISINWRLVLASPAVFDYVVVHELVHLEVRDHSEVFWARLDELMPNARQHKQWLAKNEAKLVFDAASM